MDLDSEGKGELPNKRWVPTGPQKPAHEQSRLALSVSPVVVASKPELTYTCWVRENYALLNHALEALGGSPEVSGLSEWRWGWRCRIRVFRGKDIEQGDP